MFYIYTTLKLTTPPQQKYGYSMAYIFKGQLFIIYREANPSFGFVHML